MRRQTHYDVVIIGGGPAGIAAAIWCSDLGLKCVVIDAGTELGGQLLNVHNRIENYPGIAASNGVELRDRFLNSLKGRDLETRLNSAVVHVDLVEKQLTFEGGQVIKADAIIIATGVRRRKLGVEGEDEFSGRGLLTSGAKEAESVKGKTVLVVGGGDAAFENALLLARHAATVYLAHRTANYSARKEFLDAAKTTVNINLLPGLRVERLIGDQKLTGAELIDSTANKTLNLDLDHAIIRIGVVPNSEVVRRQLDLDHNEYIQVDTSCRTSIDGIFAIGDVANPVAPTVSSAVGMAAIAAKCIAADNKNLQKTPRI